MAPVMCGIRCKVDDMMRLNIFKARLHCRPIHQIKPVDRGVAIKSPETEERCVVSRRDMNFRASLHQSRT